MPLPVASAAPVSAVAPATPQPSDAGADGASFLAQLKTALATLASAAMPRVPASSQVGVQPALEQAPAPETAPAAAEPSPPSDKPADHSTDVVPDALAALGLVPVPVAILAQPIAEPKQAQTADHTAAGGPATPVGPAGLATQPVVESAPPPAPADASHVDSKPNPMAELAPPARPTEPAQRPLVEHTADQPGSGSDSSRLAQALSSAQTDPGMTLATPTVEARPSAATGASGTAPAQLPRQQSQAHADGAHLATPIVSAERSAIQSGNGEHNNANSNDGQQSTGKNDEPAPLATHEVTAEAPAHAPDASAATSAAAAQAASAPGGAVLPTHVRPTEVVNQIAHQAELYRLPGNRGVRIQLNPEDLGGVDVTLRYSSSGGIQLHINVEHAATGALVQAGWTELRDALSTQGISPERLVMSISAPGEAKATDFSNGGDSRPDQGLAASTQDQSYGQRRQDPQDQSVVNGWSGVDSTSPTDELPRSAASSASSRIDYRV
jgi:flagellar hook-length control protein FliK